ncbi:hypothetical protein [Piscirickettsia litoralis]|uniref:hypothetical protein n=1 Tax=Piscirickettsia litoralis TaxID=1891921 RepID=UPI00130156C0|nr:hypothetical protein [Piscirickettsia litoralis]
MVTAYYATLRVDHDTLESYDENEHDRSFNIDASRAVKKVGNNMHCNIVLQVVNKELAVCQIMSGSELPTWLPMDRKDIFFSVTQTEDELSIVCDEKLVPKGVKVEKKLAAVESERAA